MLAVILRSKFVLYKDVQIVGNVSLLDKDKSIHLNEDETVYLIREKTVA